MLLHSTALTILGPQSPLCPASNNGQAPVLLDSALACSCRSHAAKHLLYCTPSHGVVELSLFPEASKATCASRSLLCRSCALYLYVLPLRLILDSVSHQLYQSL